MDSAHLLRPARFSERFVAYLLDTLPFVAASVASLWAWGSVLQRSVTAGAMAADGLVWLGLSVLWQFAGNLAGGTPGKRLLGLRVVDASGESPGVARSFVRAVSWLVLSTPFANFGFWLALFQPRTRTLHDLAAGTYVVEHGPRRSDGTLAFLGGALAAIALFSCQYWVNVVRLRPDDVIAIEKANNGLFVLAEIEEAYKEKHGTYTDSLDDLAEASGDAALFRSALLDVFRPRPFRLQAGNMRWRVVAAAKDRRNTLVTRQGGRSP
jgi:uncharacterized RDD family membrane protein YckC